MNKTAKYWILCQQMISNRRCRIVSPDKTEWRLISDTLCGWRRCFVADQLWFMTRIREEEVTSVSARCLSAKRGGGRCNWNYVQHPCSLHHWLYASTYSKLLQLRPVSNAGGAWKNCDSRQISGRSLLACCVWPTSRCSHIGYNMWASSVLRYKCCWVMHQWILFMTDDAKKY